MYWEIDKVRSDKMLFILCMDDAVWFFGVGLLATPYSHKKERKYCIQSNRRKMNYVIQSQMKI